MLRLRSTNHFSMYITSNHTPAPSHLFFVQLLRDSFDLTDVVGDRLFVELLPCVQLCDAEQFETALQRIVAIMSAFVDSAVPESFERRRDRRHWYTVLMACTCEVLKHWVRRFLARTDGMPLLSCVAALCHAYDAAARCSEFMQRVNIADVARSALGVIAAAVVIADQSVVVANDVIDAADALLRQTAAIVTSEKLLTTIASLLPSCNASGRPEAHGLHKRVTPDGVVDAPIDVSPAFCVVDDLPAVLQSALPSRSHKRDRSIDGVTGVRAVSASVDGGFGPLHAALPPRSWTPFVLSAPSVSAAALLLADETEPCSSVAAPAVNGGGSSFELSPPSSESSTSSSSSSSSSLKTPSALPRLLRSLGGGRQARTSAFSTPDREVVTTAHLWGSIDLTADVHQQPLGDPDVMAWMKSIEQ
jgi:hypothetical protein